MARGKKTLLFVAKIVMSGGLLYLLLRGGNFGRAIDLMRERFHLFPFVVGLVAFALSNVLGGIQWNILLRAQSVRIGVGRAISLYFVGLFFSNFLPANIGGDVVKAVNVYRRTGRGGGVVAATLMDRAIGLAMLAFLACVAGPLALPVIGMQPILILLPLFFLFFVVCGLMIMSRRVGSLLLRMTARIPFRFVREKGETVLRAILEYRDRRREIFTAFLVAFPVQSLRILVHFFAAKAIGIDASALYFFLFIPIIAVFIALPISINGIGIREGFGVLLYATIGIGQGEAISISFLAYMIGVAVSLAGGVFFITGSLQLRNEIPSSASLREETESR